ncbi:MAG: hypothetical protein IH991_20050, partial [Planctomycetes bacterium]|nr:hypothetical protein [Planctomycetota bacterium]
RWLVTGSTDNAVRLWDLRAQNPVGAPIVFRGHESIVRNVSISSDDRWLVSVGRELRLWDLRIDNLIDQARRVAGRELTDEERKQYHMDVLKPLR